MRSTSNARCLPLSGLLLSCFAVVGQSSSGQPHIGGEEDFIGWHGDTYEPRALPSMDGAPNNFNESSKAPWIQVISWKPRAFVYHHFLSDAEAAHIIKTAAPQMKRSTVVGPGNKGVVDNIRTSAGTFLTRNSDPIITAIEKRLAVWTQLPESHQEDMQVLRYGPTNQYKAHCDGLGRVATVLIYLVPPEEGGETAFPHAQGYLHPEAGEPSQGNFSECAKGENTMAYKPRRGDALLFFDKDPAYKEVDQASMHTGCPVVRGIKWNAVKWIHGEPFRGDEYVKSLRQKPKPPPDPADCTDLHPQCGNWAASGECTKNPDYMVGGGTGMGSCRRACNECQACPPKGEPGSDECRAENRAKGGFLNFDPSELKLFELGTSLEEAVSVSDDGVVGAQ